uniref:Saccharopine dehydrogenase NADP binding domain-containing protein n=1 Tax=Ananas comosus var. bracteatus TaxID=296719 RepID=A0A6V7P0Q8_ANACO|nr:unnamed protein product [Ananas comosus var. bracteatus]
MASSYSSSGAAAADDAAATAPPPARRSREFDVVILGASGFTGRYVVREALKALSAPPRRSAPSPSRGAPLQARRRAPMGLVLVPFPSPSIPLVPADASDPASLLALARRARLVLSCVGPFRLYGAPSPPPAPRPAPTTSTSPASPSLRELGIGRRIVGNLGTYESAVLGVANVEKLQELRRSRPRKPRPVMQTIHLLDAIVNLIDFVNNLTFPAYSWPPPPKGPLIEHQKTIGLWAIKLPSADSVVVRRTLATLTENPQGLPGVNESEDFAEKRKQFWSSVKPAHFGVKIGSKSILGVLRFIFTGLFIGLLGKYSFGRKILLKFPEIFSLGWFRKTGPTEEEVRSATFKMWFIGKGYSNQSVASQPGSKLDTEIITRVSGPEIGYLTTPIILIQCALIVLGQRENLPKGGVYTPGIVFGPTDLQQRLQENGITFDVISTKTDQN